MYNFHKKKSSVFPGSYSRHKESVLVSIEKYFISSVSIQENAVESFKNVYIQKTMHG